MNTIIIGAGPAGITAAIQLKRAGYEPLLIEKDMPGGLLKNANLVENYPGFPGGITGIDLAARLKLQLDILGIPIHRDEVIQVKPFPEGYEITCREKTFQADTLIIASGTKPKTLVDLQIPAGFEDRLGSEVHPFVDVQEKTFIIIGAGDAAFDYALNLARHNRVTILNRSDKTVCLPLLKERAENNENISIISNCRLEHIHRSEKQSDRMLINFSTDDRIGSIETDYLLTAIGRDPELSFFPEANQHKGKNLFLIGDVVNGIYRQAAIAAGDGMRCAMNICSQHRS